MPSPDLSPSLLDVPHRALPGLLSVIALLVLSACAGDTVLREAPPAEPDDELISGQGHDSGDAGSGVDRPSSPWAGINPGEMPDTVFAVAWVDLMEGCTNCYYGPTGPERYDIIDPLGQVLSSFELPFDWEEENYYPPPVRTLEASGPGRFIATNLMQGSAEFHQVVWEADAYTNEARVLARIYQRRVELPLTGEILLFSEELWPWDVQVLPDPVREGSLLLVPTFSSPYLPTMLREIWSVPYEDAAEGVLRWSVQELAPHLVPDDWGAIEPANFARLASDGSGRLILGLRGWEPDEDGANQPVAEIASFVPDEDLDVVGEAIPDAFLLPGTQVVPATEEHSTVLLSPSSYSCGPLFWWEDGESTEITLPEGDECPTLGPILDVASRTFVYSAWIGDDEYPDSHRVVISSGGQEVWSLDRFTRGLSERPVHLLAATALQR
ncbi:MAG: hypothetical protein KDA24_12555 [Deltaproteobacteria bacterium]|nr:hypothetical protein [Deltaproteobacteria bacterium]